MIKLILFDLGDVLTDYSNRFSTLSKETNIPIEKLQKIFSEYKEELTSGKVHINDLFQTLIKDENINPIELIAQDYKSILATRKLVEELSSKYEIGLLSNIYKGLVPLLIERNTIPDLNYSHKFLSCDIGSRKPNREIYDHVMNITNLKPEEIFFTDDMSRNLEIPSEIGWYTHHFDKEDSEQSVSKIKKFLLK